MAKCLENEKCFVLFFSTQFAVSVIVISGDPDELVASLLSGSLQAYGALRGYKLATLEFYWKQTIIFVCQI